LSHRPRSPLLFYLFPVCFFVYFFSLPNISLVPCMRFTPSAPSLSTDSFYYLSPPTLFLPISPHHLWLFDSSAREVFQRAPKADLCHFEPLRVDTFAVSFREAVKVIARGGEISHMSTASPRANESLHSGVLENPACLFIMSRVEATERPKWKRTPLFDESMEP